MRHIEKWLAKKGLKIVSRDFMVLKGKLAFIMGGGKFGKNALKYLKTKRCKVLVADVNPKCMAKSEISIPAADVTVPDSLADGQTAFLVGDAVKLLSTLLETKVPDLVVTAIPGNATAKVVENWLAKRRCKLEPYCKVIPRVLENIPKSLVSFVNQDSAVIGVSYMPSDIQCRGNCMPPKDFCGSTGRPKLVTMDRLLEFSVCNLTDVSKIFRSKQLKGGLGAIDGKELYSF